MIVAVETQVNGAIAFNRLPSSWYSSIAPAVWASAPRLRLDNDGYTQRERFIMHTCKWCGQELPEDEFQWRIKGKKRRETCKKCVNIRRYGLERQRRVAEKEWLFSCGLARCVWCGFIKLLQEFSNDGRLKHGKARLCTECDRARYAEGRTTEKYRIRQKRYQHSEHKMEYDREWRRRWNKTKRGIEYHRQYRKTEAYRKAKQLSTNQRRAEKRGLLGAMTKLQWDKTIAAFSGRCAYCRSKPTKLEQDHLVPLSAGGAFVFGNIVPACKNCNSSKRQFDCQKWCSRRGYDYELVIKTLMELIDG